MRDRREGETEAPVGPGEGGMRQSFLDAAPRPKNGIDSLLARSPENVY
jgi:hypothetical protein